MSHASHHNILNGTKQIEGKENYSHIVSVRSDKVQSWLDKGYEIIDQSEDAYLIGKKKA